MKILEAVQMIVDKPYLEGLVKCDGKTIGFIYWDDFNDMLSINRSGIIESMDFNLRALKRYDSYDVTFN